MSVEYRIIHASRQGVLDRFLFPWLLHGACSLPQIAAQRRKILPLAEGVVVEPGMGTGLNMAFYDAGKIDRLIGIDPAPALMAMAKKAALNQPFDVELLVDSAEHMRLEDNSADTMVLTYSLCTIPDARATLREARRVLKPTGKLLFSEHGLSNRAHTARWQNRLAPVWKRIAGGCHLNRNTERLLLEEGFSISRIEKKKLPGVPDIIGYNYRGIALPR